MASRSSWTLILDNIDRPQGGRHLPARPELLRLLHRPAHDERASSTTLFGGPPRKPEELLTQRDMDLAASIQAVTEEIVLRLARSVQKETGAKNLCLAGGVALNCVANGKLLREGIFDGIWIQPAAGDAGGALGAALCRLSRLSWASRASSTAISTAWRAPISARSSATTRSPSAWPRRAPVRRADATSR